MFLKKRFLALLAVFLFVAYAVYRLEPYVRIQMDDRQLSAILESEELDAEIGYLEGSSRKLRFLQIGQDRSKPLLVFIHGAPSSSAWWITMMRDSALRAEANILAIDRPGYGGSGLGNPMTSVREQAENVAAVIRSRRQPRQKVVVHGSSYGGTVSARLAMDFPQLVDGLLLQSASMAPKEEYTYWITHPTSHWSLSWLLPSGINTANHEKLAHQAELEAMASEWDNIDAPTVILHGTDDWLIYPRNAYYACDKLTGAPTVVHHMVKGKQHDLLYTAPKLLKHYLHYLLDRV
ncbi:2-succinyl-6-hydroxy-2, 4-cyclohexadiene-1-carboxylate synthase [Neolewinella maritima]|uniref:2-succinyl-6-hydroxy-2, 4-cyclohexadiene-1-carboxylate synthase n=1 Tax=Neolewinella maritima TaxID=1383882 RepID=A0ABN8F5P6_9BACT|nr:alpha/beta fold hydrolase [Neolewinella maritima]CAH0999435.1 2-succinyl-6-hydroxy-2, 4-cyclohexadiene-1-carboxylate synthase [Neolewinella maritima]